MTRHQLKLFRLVYEKGSFNQAAHTLYLSQAAVSQHIKKLESMLMTNLFERTPQGIKPTEAGERLYPYALEILKLMREAEEAVSSFHTIEKGSLTIGATAGVSVYILPAWLKSFQEGYPKINLTIKTSSSGELIENIRQQQVGLALFVGGLSDLGDHGLSKLWLKEIEYVVVMVAHHPWANHPAVSLKELSKAPFLNRQPQSRTRDWLDQTLAEMGIVVQNVAELDNPGVIKYGLLNELGVAILPAYAVEREVERGEIIAKRLETGPLTRPLWLLWGEEQLFDPVQKAFLRLLATEFPMLNEVV